MTLDHYVKSFEEYLGRDLEVNDIMELISVLPAETTISEVSEAMMNKYGVSFGLETPTGEPYDPSLTLGDLEKISNPTNVN